MKAILRGAHFLMLSLILMSASALAHSQMSKSDPADGGTAKAGLETLKLGFSQPVRVTLVKVRRGDEATEVPTKLKASGFASSIEVGVAPRAAGKYRMEWTALAKDGHVMKGNVSFTVTP